jgi:hypothetical protein
MRESGKSNFKNIFINNIVIVTEIYKNGLENIFGGVNNGIFEILNL